MDVDRNKSEMLSDKCWKLHTRHTGWNFLWTANT